MKAFLLVVWLAVAGGVCAADDAWLIVPGKSVGKIALGMDKGEVFRLLGAPGTQNDLAETDRRMNYTDREGNNEVPVAKDVTQSDWTTPLPLPGQNDPAGYFCDFVTVYVRDNKVVQIELRAKRFHDAHGLSSASTGVEWRKQYGRGESFDCKCHHPSVGGIPAGKHFLHYEDAVAAGIGWRCDCFGSLAPSPDPDGEVDAIIVHAPGEKALVDPDGGCRFVWKEYPIRR